MPFQKRKREGHLIAVVLAFLFATIPAYAGGPRIASINVCTDQLLLTLADADQIVGLSPYSRDAARSWAAKQAEQFTRLSGEAEDVLVLKPDFVVAGLFTKRATRELLKNKGLRVVEFDAAQSLSDTREQIRRMGELVQHPERAETAIAQLDAAISKAQLAAQRSTLRVLALSRRGWITGTESVTSSLLSAVGLINVAPELGRKSGGFATLEATVSNRPDFIIVSDDSLFAEDQGKALLLHPALERLYPPDKRIVLPQRLTVCGGPMLVEALSRLTAELERTSNN